MRSYDFHVYMLANRRDGPLYIGVTNDLERRVSEHRSLAMEGFTRRYRIRRLVWFEHHQDVETAILREKRLKKWNRAWKNRLVEEMNAEWDDLAVTYLGAPPLGLERSPPARG